MHVHTHDNDLIVGIFKQIAKKRKKPYLKIKKAFLNHSYPIEREVWKALDKKYPPGKYSGIIYCSDCDAFELSPSETKD